MVNPGTYLTAIFNRRADVIQTYPFPFDDQWRWNARRRQMQSFISGLRDRRVSIEISVVDATQVGPDQLVQSHTPLRDYVGDYADKPVLIVGGVGDAARRVAESYAQSSVIRADEKLRFEESVSPARYRCMATISLGPISLDSRREGLCQGKPYLANQLIIRKLIFTLLPYMRSS